MVFYDTIKVIFTTFKITNSSLDNDIAIIWIPSLFYLFILERHLTLMVPSLEL